MIFLKSLLCDKLIRKYYKDVQTCRRREKEDRDLEMSVGTDLETLRSWLWTRAVTQAPVRTWAGSQGARRGKWVFFKNPHFTSTVLCLQRCCAVIIRGCSEACGASQALLGAVGWAGEHSSACLGLPWRAQTQTDAKSNQLTYIRMNQSCVFLTGILTDLTL